jgi:hypothetical protein
MTRRVIIAAAVLAASGAPALAEPQIGSRLGDRYESRTVKDDRDRAEGAHELANCLVGKKSREVRAYLSATTEADSNRLGKKLGGDIWYCFMKRPMNDLVDAQRVSYPPAILRGMLAEELIRKQKSTFAQLPAVPIQKSYSRAWFDASFRDAAVNEMATCVADTNPAGIVALLQSDAYTDGEDAAFTALMPSLGPCLAAGTQLSGEREPLRAALADALFQRINFPAEAEASGAAE